MAQRQDLDGDPDLDAPRTRRQRGGDDEGRGQDRPIFLEVDLGEPYSVETQILGRLHLRQRLVERRRRGHARRARELREQAEFHFHLPIEFGLSYARAARDGGPRMGGGHQWQVTGCSTGVLRTSETSFCSSTST